MSSFDFTPAIRDALLAARDCALEMRHEYVGTEHLLLGLVRRDDGPAAATLAALGISRDQVRTTVLGHMLVGKATNEAGSDLPYTSRSQKVIELAMIAAQERGDHAVSPIHLLLGLSREERGIGAQVLMQLGAGPAELLAAIDRLGTSDGTADTGHDIGAAPRAIPAGEATIEPTADDATIAPRGPTVLGIVVALMVAALVLWVVFR